MKFGGEIDFPDDLLKAISDDQLVVFAGAGVSIGEPANLPNFDQLANQIATGHSLVRNPEQTVDVFLGQLRHAEVKVHELACKHLSSQDILPTHLHKDLLRLFVNPKKVRVVTTNFDQLFQKAANDIWHSIPEVFRAPALPLGRKFNGIVHLHGSVVVADDMVLTDSDFGRAYLTEGWARRFLVELFRNYTVLFVGYSHNDTVMKYLARALPIDGVKPRFVLTEKRDGGWKIFGIEPVFFPMPAKKNDYAQLYDGVRHLAEHVQRGALDWHRMIKELAEKPPPSDSQQIEHALYALKEVMTTRFFTAFARDPAWLEWLDRHRILDPLFEEGRLDERGQLLVQWIAEHYAAIHATQVFLLVGKHELRINPSFWANLTRHLALTDPPPPADILARWVTILLQSSPNYNDRHLMTWLAKKCTAVGAYLCSLEIFGFLAQSRLQIKESDFAPEDTPLEQKISVDLLFKTDHYGLQEIWEDCLKPHLDKMAPQVSSFTISTLERNHAISAQWGRATDKWDSASFRRSAIEPHEQDKKYPREFDVVIDAARESLEWLMQNDPVQLAGLRERLARSDAPLLRRLALYAAWKDEKWPANDKTVWLLARFDLHDLWLKHEIYMLLQHTYPSLEVEQRKKIIGKIEDYRWPKEDYPGREEHEERHRYDLLHWLSTADTQCKLVSSALGILQNKYPQWRPSEHPDLSHWSGDAVWVGPQSPWAVEQLLARSAAEWLDELLTFKGEKFLGPDRDGLLQYLTDAIKQDFEWGQGLADALASRNNYDSDLWEALLRAWSEWPNDKEKALRIIDWLEHEELLAVHSRITADVLYALVRGVKKDYFIECLPICNQIAEHLWKVIERNADESTDDWLQDAINRPAGVLAEYWLNSLSAWNKQPLSGKTKKLEGEYLINLTAMVQDDTSAGAYARTILASQFAFLLSADEEWTKEHVLPLFTDTGLSRLQQAWDGFLVSGSLTPGVAVALTPAILAALPKLAGVFPSNRGRFIEYFAAFIAFHAEDPLTVYIPEFFRYATPSDRANFTGYLEQMMQGLDESHQKVWWNTWLRKYWENRIAGIPAPLNEKECEKMLGWLPHLSAIFVEAVELAIKMPCGKIEQINLPYELKDSPLIAQYPEAMAKLVMHLLECQTEPYNLYGLNEIIKALSNNMIEPTLKKKLIEKLMEKRFDATLLQYPATS